MVIDGCSVQPYERKARHPSESACWTKAGITFAPPSPNASNDEVSTDANSGCDRIVMRKNVAPPVRVTRCSCTRSSAHFGSHPSIRTSFR